MLTDNSKREMSSVRKSPVRACVVSEMQCQRDRCSPPVYGGNSVYHSHNKNAFPHSAFVCFVGCNKRRLCPKIRLTGWSSWWRCSSSAVRPGVSRLHFAGCNALLIDRIKLMSPKRCSLSTKEHGVTTQKTNVDVPTCSGWGWTRPRQ